MTPSSDGYVLVDFYADWCEPCKWALPVIEDVLNQLQGKIVLEKIDIDRSPEIAKYFHVMSVPTFVLFHNKEEVWRMRGFDTAPNLFRIFKEKLNQI